MIDAEDFIGAVSGAGVGFFSGVPCSFLTPLMNAAITSPHTRHVGATSEGEAVAIAAGLDGRYPLDARRPRTFPKTSA